MADESDCESVCTDITLIHDDESQGGQFLKACRVGTGCGIRELMKFTIPNFETLCNRNGKSGMCLACSTGNLDAVKELVQSDLVDINMSDNEGNTPLMMAVQAGYEEIVRYLLFHTRKELDIDAENQGGFTALMQAALHGRTNCARMIVIAGADVTKQDWGRGLRADQWALTCGQKTTAAAIRNVAKCILSEDQIVELNWMKRTSGVFSFVSTLRQQICRVLGLDGNDWSKEAGALYHLTARASAINSSIVLNSNETEKTPPRSRRTKPDQQKMVCIDHHPHEVNADGVLMVEIEYGTSANHPRKEKPTVTQKCFRRGTGASKEKKSAGKKPGPLSIPDLRITNASPTKKHARRAKIGKDSNYLAVPRKNNKRS